MEQIKELLKAVGFGVLVACMLYALVVAFNQVFSALLVAGAIFLCLLIAGLVLFVLIPLCVIYFAWLVNLFRGVL